MREKHYTIVDKQFKRTGQSSVKTLAKLSIISTDQELIQALAQSPLYIRTVLIVPTLLTGELVLESQNRGTGVRLLR